MGQDSGGERKGGGSVSENPKGISFNVFIVDGSAFDPESSFIRLCGLSKSELSTIQRVVARQGALDFVVRSDAQGDV